MTPDDPPSTSGRDPPHDRDSDRDPSADSGSTGDRSPDVGWPVSLGGVTESVTATRGPNDRWNLAALGLYAPGRAPDEVDTGGSGEGAAGEPASGEDPRTGVTARTWGRTRTRRNFEERGGGYVLFLWDPLVFVDAALGIIEREDPVHPAADAWARVTVERLESGESGGTEWVDWRLTPRNAGVRTRQVRTIDRGFSAVVEATVVASRLDVDDYDTAAGLRRLDRLAGIVETCGDDRDRRAYERIDEHVDWRSRSE